MGPLIHRMSHASLLPEPMPFCLQRHSSLPCVVCQAFATLYGQNEASGEGHGSEAKVHHITPESGRGSTARYLMVRLTLVTVQAGLIWLIYFRH